MAKPKLDPTSRNIALVMRIADEILSRGKTDPITSKQLQEKYGISNRTVQLFIEGLRDGGKLIGSNGRGYYAIRSEEELNETIGHLDSRAKDMLTRCSRMREAFRNESQRALA